MTRNLYILEEVTHDEILELKEKEVDIVTFDYASHKQLVKHINMHKRLTQTLYNIIYS